MFLTVLASIFIYFIKIFCIIMKNCSNAFGNMVWVVPILFVYFFEKCVIVYSIFYLIIQDKSSTKECAPTLRSIENELLNTTRSIDSISKRSILNIESCFKNSTTQNNSYSENEVFGSNIQEKDE